MTQRIKWIDVAKGWGIILLIYGHIADDVIVRWLYTFHIPLFFFLSGYVFNPNKSFKDLIQSKSRSLLLPYLTLGIPLIIINLFYGYKLPNLICLFIIQERMFPLWFITALFLQIIICFFIINKLKKNLQIITIIILSLIGIGFWRLGGHSLPWNLDISLVTIPFFYVGWYLKSYGLFQTIFNKNRFLIYFTIFLTANVGGGLIIHLMQHPNIDLFTCSFGFEPLTYPTAFLGILATITFSNRFYSKILSYIGQNSLVFFAWQQDIAIMFVNKVLLFSSIDCLSNHFKIIIILVCSLCILTAINEIINRTILKKLIGK